MAPLTQLYFQKDFLRGPHPTPPAHACNSYIDFKPLSCIKLFCGGERHVWEGSAPGLLVQPTRARAGAAGGPTVGSKGQAALSSPEGPRWAGPSVPEPPCPRLVSVPRRRLSCPHSGCCKRQPTLEPLILMASGVFFELESLVSLRNEEVNIFKIRDTKIGDQMGTCPVPVLPAVLPLETEAPEHWARHPSSCSTCPAGPQSTVPACLGGAWPAACLLSGSAVPREAAACPT